MKKSYYRFQAQIVPGWTLPHRDSLKVESITVRPHPRIGALEVNKRELRGGLSSRPMDTGRLIDPPQVTLANLGIEQPGGAASEEQVLRFTAQYGSLGVKSEEIGEPETPFWLDLATFHDTQRRLREAWTKQDPDLFTDPSGLVKGQGFDLWPINWKVKGHRLEIRPTSCYTYMQILLVRDIAAGLAKVCKNKKCPAPYFVAKRRDQRYCSAKCAGPAKRAAKLKWWRGNRQRKSLSRR